MLGMKMKVMEVKYLNSESSSQIAKAIGSQIILIL